MNAIKIVFFTEFIIFAIGVWVIVFQVWIPLVRGTPFFPILRSRPRKAAEKLAAAREKREINDTEESARRTIQLRGSTKGGE